MHLEAATGMDMEAAKGIQKFAGTMSYGVLYEIGTGGDLLGWYGSIYIGGHEDRKSTHDYDFKLGPTTISWSSNKQPICETQPP